jgi:hypothetical protein
VGGGVKCRKTRVARKHYNVPKQKMNIIHFSLRLTKIITSKKPYDPKNITLHSS